MFRLFASPGACSQISIIILEKAQANYELHSVHLAKGEHKKAEYLSINPKGKVPALMTKHGVLTETPAIVLFLHEEFENADILPANYPVTEVVSDLSWFASFIHPLITRYAKPDLIGVTTEVDAVKTVAQTQLNSAYRSIEKRLSASPFWNGDNWSAVDVYLFWTINRLKRAGFAFSEFDHVIQHYQKMLASPVVKRALLKESAL
ncbi:glutathione S-transferase family protein [Alteromonas gilva]|uniref:Glutathione S-transferase family protein n=1 Tax=Alteromonas gilva TaxID=2987522 RepID=A0ABT5L7Q5_9ALTE|nr:glutathione S-transferase family protein [Alteromonas gilva]MDC8833056.1 glutathione S-transferase family protein [Alteromonas gilva]